MIFKTNTIDIEFWTTLPGLEKIEPVKRATEFMPEWFKNMPAYTGMAEPKLEDKGTVKRCPGIIDLFKDAFVIPLWCDLELDIESEQNFRFRPSNDNCVFQVHPNAQFLDHVQTDYTLIFKPISPWHIRTPKGYSVMQLPMYYHFNDQFDVLPGTIWTDMHHEVNPQMAIKKKGRFTITKGTPLAMYIPFKREATNLKISEYTDEYKKADDVNNTWMRSKFVGAYRMWQNKFKDG